MVGDDMSGAQKATVTILGCGWSNGVPTVGNKWGACDPKDPKNARTRTSALVRAGKMKVLIDCGPDFRMQSSRHNIRTLSAILFSHGHGDHIHGVPELPMMMEWNKGGIDCFATQQTAKTITDRFAYLFNGEGVFHYGGVDRSGSHLRMNEMVHGQDIVVGDLAFTPFAQVHGGIGNTGFRFGDVVYSGDISALNDETRRMLVGVDTWILECESISVKGDNHIHLAKALDWVKEIKPRRAILTHMSDEMDYKKTQKLLPPNVELAYDGMEFDVLVPCAPKPCVRRLSDDPTLHQG